MLAEEHFCDGATQFTCSAAPIFFPATLEIAGVLDVSAPYKLVRPDLLGLIMPTALDIEERFESTLGYQR